MNVTRWIFVVATSVACASQRDAKSPGQPGAAVHATTPGTLPRIGLAVRDTAGTWCAEVASDSAREPLAVGSDVTLVFPAPGSVASVAGRIGGPRTSECAVAFAQPRWTSYTAYQLEVTGTLAADASPVALLVANNVPWTRGPDGIVHADIDADGVPEDARRCLADEGEHFTVWSILADNRREQRWHEYFDWGAFTDANCRPGENGRDSR